MSKGALMSCPVLLINLGGEMIYILDQRLKAQNVAKDKAAKILNDSAKTMFAESFIDQLFEPQKIFSVNYTKTIFDKIVHSSIMTLNTTSMSKLFDLMMMGFKYQVIASNFPQQIYHITLAHLDGIINLLKDGPSVKLAESVKKLFIAKYSKFTPMEFLFLRKELLKFFQDKTIRVSVFLQDELQNSEGKILVQNTGTGNVGHKKPGRIIYYAEDGSQLKTDSFQIECSQFVQNSNSHFTENIVSNLGNNLYAVERVKKGPVKGVESRSYLKSQGGPPKAATTGGGSQPIQKKQAAEDKDAWKKEMTFDSTKAKKELNDLASLLGGHTGKEKSDEMLNFNLFPDLSLTSKVSFEGEAGADMGSDVIFIDSIPNQKEKIKSVLDSLDDSKGKPAENQKQEMDDLLDLMDNA